MMRGIIEGFYGTPWSWEERSDLAAWCGERGMDTFVYAPKDDPKHRDQWRAPYDVDELRAFETFASASPMQLSFAVSPGLSIDVGSTDDIRLLMAKCRSVIGAGASSVVLALDDIPPTPSLGTLHARLFERVRGEFDSLPVVLVPTDYTSIRSTAYLDDLAAGLDGDALVAWTGPTVVSDEITVEQAQARSTALGGRRPVLWDNYPVNDAVMADRLFMGPLRGRSHDLLDALAGYVANPMVQAAPNRLPLASTAAWLRGEDPAEAWERTADELGWRTFAEACDGEAPLELVARYIQGDESELRSWLDKAVTCVAPGLEGVVDDWLAQVHREATVALDALDRIGSDEAFGWIGLLLQWRSLQRSRVSVLGPRWSVRPVARQDEHGGFVVDSPGVSLTKGRNAVDRLLDHLTNSV